MLKPTGCQLRNWRTHPQTAAKRGPPGVRTSFFQGETGDVVLLLEGALEGGGGGAPSLL